MKNLIVAASIASVLTLSGCGLKPMIVKEANQEPINGFDVSVTNIEKISAQKINLTFTKDKDGVNDGFPWHEVEQEVKEKLTSKGIVLSPDGRPVNVELKKFEALGSNHAQVKIARTSGMGAAIGQLGGSLAQVVLADQVDRKLAKDKAESQEGDGKHFVADVAFTVKSNNYESEVQLTALQAIYSYVSNAKRITAHAISEFFTKTN